MTKILQLLVLLLIVSSCCLEDPVETARYELSAKEQELLPYMQGQTFDFVHSSGYTFKLNVTKNHIEWKEHHDFCEWNCCGNPYYSYQVRTAVLESDYPKFRIEFSLGDARMTEYQPSAMNVNVNHGYFLQLPYDSLANFIQDSKTIYYDSISLNNQMFYEVIKSDFDYLYDNQDSTLLVPKSFYFNHLGMIQLKMSNNETYTINN